MAIYLGSGQKVKLNFGNSVCSLIIPSATPVLNEVKLLSSDNYILKDSNGIYLTAKEDK